MRGFGTTIFAEMSALAVATGSINLGQGFPDTDGPAELPRRRGRGVCAPGTTSTRPGPGIPALRQAIADHQQRCYGLDLRPGHRGAGDRRRHRGDRGRAAGARRRRRRGRAVRAVLRLLRRLRRAGRGAPARRHPRARRRRGWGFDPAALERAVTPRTKALLLNTPHNPTGHGVRRRPSWPRSPTSRIRHDLVVDHRRGLRAPASSTARRHVPIATLPGMRERTDHDQQRRQDVQRHRLEDRLGLRAAAAARGRAHGEAVPDLRQRRAVPAGGRRRRWPRAETLAPRAARCRPSATCSATGWPSSGSTCVRPQATYFATVDLGAADADAVQFCRELPAPSRRRRDPEPASSTTPAPATATSGSRSASSRRCSTRRCAGWRRGRSAS